MRGRLNQERMTDGLCFRTSPGQRQFLEQYAEEQNVSLCEAARRVLDAGIKNHDLVVSIELKAKGVDLKQPAVTA